MSIKKIMKKKAILIDRSKSFFAKGNRVSKREKSRNQTIIKLPVKKWELIAMNNHLLSRLLRIGVHHFIYDGYGGYYCVYNKKCARFSAKGKLVGEPVNIVGGRPLRIDLYNGMMVYGEYRSNPERSTVSVMIFDGYQHRPLFNVENVRHIHTVKVKNEKIYFSTGDYGDEAGIWFWDGKEIKPILKGDQQRRAVDFILADDFIYYGTDTPLEQNYIYKASYEGKITPLQKVSGSVFYMSEQTGRYWLATVVEPSKVNTSRLVQLWSADSTNTDEWKLIETFKKDMWPLKLFQYGQIQFPYIYDTNNKETWFYLQGVRGSGKTIKYLSSQ